MPTEMLELDSREPFPEQSETEAELLQTSTEEEEGGCDYQWFGDY